MVIMCEEVLKKVKSHPLHLSGVGCPSSVRAFQFANYILLPPP
jgi:hypothetical protein